MKTKMTVIVDNISGNGLAGEWGLSILAQASGSKILIDAGSTELFADNLALLGYDIGDIDYAVLSHAHYDHANGMPRLLRDNDKVTLYVRETTFPGCYKIIDPETKYIGIPKELMTEYKDRIRIVSGDHTLFDGVYLIPHKTPGLEAIGKREHMFILTERGWKTDDFSHEQSVVFDTDKGLVIVSSCSHGGAVNIINEIRATFPDRHIYGLVGGLHLYNKEDDEIRAVARNIADTGIDHVYTGHCTEEHAYGILKEELGDRVEQFRTGLVMDF